MIYELLKSAHLVAMAVWTGGTVLTLAVLAGRSEAGPAVGPAFRAASGIAMAVVFVCGISIMALGDWFSAPWMIAKLVFVLVLAGMHGAISGPLKRGGTVKARPLLAAHLAALTAIVLLAVIRPG